MFIGHFAVGMAAKRVAPKASLGSLFLAAQFVDLLWPTLLLLGLETVRIDPTATAVTPLDFVHYPISHSLVSGVGWAILIGGLTYLFSRRVRDAVVMGCLVVSHWFLDLVVHRPDLPLYPGGPKLGFDLWASKPMSVVVELGLFMVGALVYIRATRPTDKTGRFAFMGLILFLLLIYAGNLFGAPPPSATAIAWVGQAQWLIVLWAYWADRHRHPVEAA
ncbi:hypothetical protein [Kordiimonas marina]|uniref:hypothetical protein n=1 Tax=Kordiimonas marina TaxID=2872312 RepID=UPI001FF39A37|nr:hypothetical protein [Kordiimonas marina]MCJ9429567.1 hypothetical protein [Kordiimonas marina]